MISIETLREIRKLIQDLGFSFILDSKDRLGTNPLIRGYDLYCALMDSERCKELIDKLREFQMKAFK